MEKGLNEKKNDLITRAEEVLNKAKEEKRELTEAEAEELAEIRDNVRRIMKTLELKGEFDKMEGNEIEKESLPKDEAKTEVEIEKEERALNEEKAFENYIRGVVNNRDTSYNMTLSDNGAVIPTTIANRIIKKVYDISPILERSTKYNVKGKLELPYYDVSTQTITVAWATEFEELNSSVGKLKSISLDGYLAGALTLISRSLINNSQFDIVAFVVDEMAYSIHRFIENVLLNGSGDVEGLSTLTNTKTTASSTAVTSNELIEAQAQVKDVFQANAIWIMSPATRTAIRELKDNYGRYLLQDDISLPFGKSLLGKPVYVSDNMPDMSAGVNAIYYGDMKGLATKFSEDINIQVLREKYATQHAVGVVGWLEFDSAVEDAQKIVAVKMAGQTPSA
jgi:HK97 family phage major capsid protein